MKKRYLLSIGITLMLGAIALPASAQVSNDNEDGVYKVDERMRDNNFVPGQVLVKFKDESSISVRRNAKGMFRAASISAVDKLLREYGVDDMEKLFPSEVSKPKSQLRRKVAPNGTVVQERNLDKIFWIKTHVQSSDSTLQLIESLKGMEEVEYAEPNYRVYITADGFTGEHDIPRRPARDIRLAPVRTETDANVICANPSQNPLYSQQYGITQQNIHQLWNKPIINKKRPVIAILDTGVDIEHPDLKGNIWQNTKEVEGELAYDDDNNGIVDDKYGWNFADDYYDLTDYNGHGTHVAGIAAACDNSIGIVGANPLALIMPVKVLDDKGVGDVATICRGIIYAAENGADVINMSLGHPKGITATEIDAIKKAYQSAVIVASAGNYGSNIYSQYGSFAPACYYLVLGVQSTDEKKALASFSNFDPDGPIFSEDGADGRNFEVEIAGVDIYGTFPGGIYKAMSGTSMSSPLFAGAVSALQMVKEFPSKDVLFGDLIHLNGDFKSIYSDETSRYPDIDLISVSIDDNVLGNIVNDKVDVGETILVTPTLRNTWADASNIKLSLSANDVYKSFVDIENPEVDFGHSLSAYARSEAATPFRIKISDKLGDNTRVKFEMKILSPESNQVINTIFYVTVHNQIYLKGLITEDMTLTSGKNYVVDDRVYVANNATLTIEPGTYIKMGKPGETGLSTLDNGKIKVKGKPGEMIHLEGGSSSGAISFEYAVLDNCGIYGTDTLRNCILNHCSPHASSRFRNVVTNVTNNQLTYDNLSPDSLTNFVNNNIHNGYIPTLSKIGRSNYVNNYCEPLDVSQGKYAGRIYSFAVDEDRDDKIEGHVMHYDNLPYMGTSREDIIRPYIWEFLNAPVYMYQDFTIDLSNMQNQPFSDAHGMVWKVVVNGKDAQDEFEDLPPLGVGKHKFEIYYNRPMNRDVAPQISFGVREPYTQHTVDEDGGWNEAGTIYTAYKTITGKTMSDGPNRIYVQGAEDDEYFPCIEEKTRFNIIINAVGSMATGFAAEVGLGYVKLKWNNEENNFDDAMGFNIYRYGEPYEKIIPPGLRNDGYHSEPDTIMVTDTLRLNRNVLDISTAEFIDYDVIPGQAYHYYYKVLSTDLTEYDVSNVVAATPLTATLGDANGSGNVDVADVITTVNYASGQQPKPFIFEAADMNTDQMINILDIIGIIKTIINPKATAIASIDATATYTIEDGTLYVESPVTLAGVQVQISNSQFSPLHSKFEVASDLDGFEHTSAWLSDNDYIFLAYNMNDKTLNPGKHALLHIGNGQIAQMCLSDVNGHNVVAIGDDATKVNRMASDVMNVPGIYDLQGRKLTGDTNLEVKLPKGVYIINGKKVIK